MARLTFAFPPASHIVMPRLITLSLVCLLVSTASATAHDRACGPRELVHRLVTANNWKPTGYATINANASRTQLFIGQMTPDRPFRLFIVHAVNPFTACIFQAR